VGKAWEKEKCEQSLGRIVRRKDTAWKFELFSFLTEHREHEEPTEKYKYCILTKFNNNLVLGSIMFQIKVNKEKQFITGIA
jgi:hypothetical protein